MAKKVKTDIKKGALLFGLGWLVFIFIAVLTKRGILTSPVHFFALTFIVGFLEGTAVSLFVRHKN